MAIVSLVTTFLFWPAGLVTGIITKKQIKQSGEQGEGLALAGIIISAIEAALAILLVVLIVIPTFTSIVTTKRTVDDSTTALAWASDAATLAMTGHSSSGAISTANQDARGTAVGSSDGVKYEAIVVNTSDGNTQTVCFAPSGPAHLGAC